MIELFDICDVGNRALREFSPASPIEPIHLPALRNPMQNVLSFLPMRDLACLSATCKEQRKRVHEYWLQIVETFKNPPITPDNEILREQRMMYDVIASNCSREQEDVNQNLEGIKFRLQKVIAFCSRRFTPREIRLCNPEIRGPSEVHIAYQKIYDRDLLVFANVIAEKLSHPKFNSSSEAKAWLNDPNNQEQLQEITELNLRQKELKILPAEIGQLTALESLHVGNNQLTSLPPEIGQLTALQELTIKNNQLTSLPPEIGQLTALQGLGVSDNQLTSLPPEIGQLTALQGLGVSFNQLTSLPPEIGQLTALKRLYVSDNQLTSLPPKIGQLTALESLHVGNNQLTSLPPEIGQLTALERLSIANNQLTSLPPEIGQLTALRELFAENNQFSSLPPEIGQLTALRELFAENNQFSSLPPEIDRSRVSVFH